MNVSHKIENITKSGNWILVKDASFKPFESPWSCANTVSSKCIRGNTPEECVKICKDSEYCDAGYWVKIPGEASYCLPIATGFLQDSNPSYYAFNKNDISQAKNIDTYYFVNTEKYPFPDYRVNYIFENDQVFLQNVETNTFVSNKNSKDPSVEFSPNGDIKLEVFLNKIQAGDAIVNIRNDDFIFINPVGTGLIMQKLSDPIPIADEESGSSFFAKRSQQIPGDKNLKKYYKKEQSGSDYLYNKNYIRWFGGLSWDMIDWKGGIQIHCPDKKPGEKLLYNDQFMMIYGGVAILGLQVYGGISSLIPLAISLDEIKEQGIPYLFKFSPQFSVYYCENDNCNQINISQTKLDPKNPEISIYNGRKVTRDGKCFGQCHYKYPANKSQIPSQVSTLSALSALSTSSASSTSVPSPNDKSLYNSLWIAGMAVLFLIILILIVKFVK